MRRLVCFLMVLGLILGARDVSFAADSVYDTNIATGRSGWSIFANDDDIDAALELITELDTTYAQLSAEEAIEVLSSAGGDTTQTVTVIGINDSGKKASEDFTLAGATVQTSTTVFRYVDQVSVDAECAGTITVRKKTGDTFITSIPIGALEASMAQHFNGEYVSYITSFSARCTSVTGTVLLDLRWYPDDADCLDPTDGFIILDSIQFTNVLGTEPNIITQPIRCPAGGYIAVYGLGGAANSDASVTIQGFDTRR